MQFEFKKITSEVLRWMSMNKKRVGQTLIIVLILLFAIAVKAYESNKENVSVEASEAELEGVDAYADISGEVNKPGIYKIDDDTRVFEIIDMAGGLTSNADIEAINQAEFVTDGQKIIIPSVSSEESNSNTSTDGKSSGKININTASKEDLMTLNGIGDSISERIITYRKSNRFNSTEDIKNVSGIGDATYEKIKDDICV
jgi:competence protein ComEA